MKKSKNIMFVISRPDVYKSPTSDSYVIFGEAKIEDLAAKQAQLAQQEAAARSSETARSMLNSNSTADSNASTEKAVVEEEAVDETGVDPKDIALVVDQAHCTRAQAVTALKNNNNDIVNAIMELTI